jgi:hypothetical protein
MDEMAHWEGTNESSDSPIPVFSSSSVQSQEDRILGDLGVMAVQGFFGSGLSVVRFSFYILARPVGGAGGYGHVVDPGS